MVKCKCFDNLNLNYSIRLASLLIWTLKYSGIHYTVPVCTARLCVWSRRFAYVPKIHLFSALPFKKICWVCYASNLLVEFKHFQSGFLCLNIYVQTEQLILVQLKWAYFIMACHMSPQYALCNMQKHLLARVSTCNSQSSDSAFCAHRVHVLWNFSHVMW